MGRKTSPNISYYHYRVDFKTPTGAIESKYYYTKNDICFELQTSLTTINKMFDGSPLRPCNPAFKNITIYKDYKPALLIVKNKYIFGQLDELE